MMEDLGAGFYLAMHDLEIRGAGEVLGESQSGGIHDVGFALYTEMLEHAVKSLRAGREPDLSRPLAVATEVNLHAPALLPEDYCGDVHERLVIYKRLANGATDEDLQRLTEELVDRFGELPEPARVLLECHRLRIQGAPLGVARIDASPSAIVVQFVPEPPVDGRRIIALVQSGGRYRMPGPDRVRIEVAIADLRARAAEVRQFLKRLAGP
jgi:transcription-repair coupling factor (superfamily II helicase)